MEKSGSPVNCPNCGAVAKDRECAYCGTPFNGYSKDGEAFAIKVDVWPKLSNDEVERMVMELKRLSSFGIRGW